MGCPECGLDYEAMPVEETAEAVRKFGKRYRAPLTRLLPGEDESVLHTRPAPDTWSALEYTAHVRDVLERYAGWITLILAEDRPALEGLTPDEAVVALAYNEQVPATVVEELAAGAEGLADILAAVPPDGWRRTGVRQGEERSVELMARVSVHEGNHHLLDIGRGLRTVRAEARAPDPPAAGSPAPGPAA